MNSLSVEVFETLNRSQTAVRFGMAGLHPNYIDSIERDLELPLPPDFRFLLQNMSDPDGVFFPWASFSRSKYVEAIARVKEGIKFDILQNGIWLKRWGQRPGSLDEAVGIFERDFVTWPRLVPVFGHRYLAVDPCVAGNPVFSIMQTDIIHYGANLAQYLLNELVPGRDFNVDKAVRNIPIWSDFAGHENGEVVKLS